MALPLHRYKEKEVNMVSIQLNENKHNLLIGVIMVVVAIFFLLYMGSSMVRSTKAFWEESSIERLLQ